MTGGLNDTPRDRVRIEFPEIPGFRESVRAIVREELAEAFRMLGREADHLDMPYGTEELDSRALSNIVKVAEGTVARLVCPHERYSSWYHGQDPRCSQCGEPEAVPANPFEEESHG